MSAEYSVEEVRNAARLLDGLSRRMLIDYAERIKADARPVARSEAVAWRWRRHAKDAWHYDQFDSIEDMAAQEMRAKGWDVELLFDRPPAQAAQVDDSAVASFVERAASVICGKLFPTGSALAKAREISDLALSMLTTPEPMAQGEADLCDCDADKYNKLPHHADCAVLAAQPRAVPADFAEYLKDPTNVHVMMLRGVIAIPSIRSIVHLRGEVPNGEDAQLARIAELQEQVATLKDKPAERVPDAIVELVECRKRGWNDSAPAYRAGWNDCRDAYFAAQREASQINQAQLTAAPSPGESE